MEVRIAAVNEVGELARVLAAAFADDPVWRWMIPREAGRIRRLERFFALEIAHVALPAGEVWTTPGREGAALVMPPGKWRMPMTQQLRHGAQFTSVFGLRLPYAFGLLTRMEAKHLREPHVYFAYIGVAPHAQGRGVGTAVMTPALEHADQQGLVAYLEASSPGSARLYRRLGFEDIGEVRFAGSPPVVLMRRDPA